MPATWCPTIPAPSSPGPPNNRHHVNVAFSRPAWSQFLQWHEADRDIFLRIVALIEDTRRHPFTGLGKPEPLKGPLKGCWSRRITGEHRLVYAVRGSGDDQQVTVLQCRYHY